MDKTFSNDRESIHWHKIRQNSTLCRISIYVNKSNAIILRRNRSENKHNIHSSIWHEELCSWILESYWTMWPWIFVSAPSTDKLYEVRAVATIIRGLRTMAAPPQVEILIPYRWLFSTALHFFGDGLSDKRQFHSNCH